MSFARGCTYLFACALSFATAERADAQAESEKDQIIEDPELAALSGEEVGSTDEEQIDDPELSRSSARANATTRSETPPPAFTSEARLRLHTRLGLDYLRSDAREETWENTTIAALELTVRRSESLRFVVGMRARYHFAALSHDVPDAAAQRVELDAAPTAGYADIELARGANLQLGYQSVHLGRFDLVSAVDVLSVGDFRDGPATLPDAYEVAQLGARLDYAPTSALSLRVLYVPFFTPHIVSVAESDYALVRLSQSQVSSGVSAFGLANNVLASNLSRTDRERLAESGLAALAPEANLSSQQAALRATLHGAVGELSFTAATALEHLPAFYFTQAAIDYLRDSRTVEVVQRFQQTARPIRVEYGRFALLALDAAIDLSPVSVGFEAAYMFHRTLYSLGTGSYPDTLPLPDTTDVVQVGSRVEYVRGTELATSVEAFGAYAVRTPSASTRSWVSLERGRYLAGIAAVGGWAPDFGLRIAVGVAAMTGFTLVLMPRVGYELLENLEIELGSIIIQGPPPPVNVTPHVALGTLYDTTDQVFVGVSYSL